LISKNRLNNKYVVHSSSHNGIYSLKGIPGRPGSGGQGGQGGSPGKSTILTILIHNKTASQSIRNKIPERVLETVGKNKRGGF